MMPSPDAVTRRLAAVEPTLVAPSVIAERQAQGAAVMRDSRADVLRIALDTARRNPILAAAFCSGAVEASDAGTLACAQAALGASLVWWGAFGEAQAWLERAASHPAPDPLTASCTRWYRTVAARRMGRASGVAESLFETANALDAMGERLLAQRCRLDAASGLPVDRAEEARALTDSLRSYFEAEGQRVDVCIIDLTRAFTLFARDHFEDAQIALDNAERIAAEDGYPALEGFAWVQRTMRSRIAWDPTKALRWADRAIERAVGLRHDYYTAVSLAELAAIHNLRGDTAASLDAHQRIRSLNRLNILPGTIADSELTLADHHYEQGEHALAEQGFRRAQKLYEKAGNTWVAAVCQARLGRVEQQQGRFTEALHDLTAGLKGLEAHGTSEDVQKAHHHLGQLYAALGYYEPAILHLRTALEMAEATAAAARSTRPAIGLSRLLTADTRVRDWTEAERLLRSARAAAETAALHADIAECDLALGDLHMARGAAEAALDAYQRSRARYETLSSAQQMTRAALSVAEAEFALGRVDAAETHVGALPDGDRLAVEDRWQATTLTARLAAARGEPGRALDAYTDALLAIRQARRSLDDEAAVQRFVLKLWPVYREAFALALEQHDTPTALMLAELHGAHLLAARRGYAPAGKDHLRALPHTLAERLTARLGEAWTVLRTVWDGHNFHAFVLTPAGLDVYRLPLDARAAAALSMVSRYDDSFRRNVFMNDGAAAQTRLRVLAEALLPEPVRRRLTPDHTLIVVPSERLHAVPFQALLDGDVPLAARTRLSYARSLDVLARTMGAAPAARPLDGRGLVLYQSEFSQPGYAPLPYVPEEVVAVESTPAVTVRSAPLAGFPPDRMHALARSGALARYDWLHFATHAAVDPMTGAFTGLLAADGMLDVADIRRWQLGARLVTLSACQTGLGTWHYGDEFDGLVQAFLAAGAHTLVASLWLAADEVTAGLMAEFYRRLAAGESASAALAGAQRTAIAEGQPAYYWAPFSVFGVP